MPFLDLAPVNAPVEAAVLAEIEELFGSGAFTDGPAVERFERSFAAYCGVAHCVGLASGLDALRLGLVALGLEPGDEVIVPAQTFVATFEAVAQAGGVPVPADIGESDLNLDPDAAAAAVSERTRFLLPVHLFGQLADMVALRALAERQGLVIVEDACQAHGATRDGLRAGTAGDAAAFSFYPTKNLGAAGDAGALVTEKPELGEQVRALRQHGQYEKYRHRHVGYTARLDTVQAIVLAHKLPLLDQWNAERRAAAAYYTDALHDVGDLRLPEVPAGSDPVWHLYSIRTASPDVLAGFLRSRGIGTGRHYPEAPHLSEAFASLGFGPGSFPVAEATARDQLSLPLFPGITETQLARVCEAVREFFGRGG